MFARAKLVPRRIRTEARFQAADPWNGNAPAEISIETYYHVPAHVREIPSPCRWDCNPLYALRSEIDGVERFLPDALSHLWIAGKMPAEALPGLLREMEPDLAKADFRPLMEATTERRWTAVLLAVLLAAVGLLMTWPRGNEPEVSWLAVLCGGVMMAGALGAFAALPRYFARRRRRRRQIGWALSRRESARAA